MSFTPMVQYPNTVQSPCVNVQVAAALPRPVANSLAANAAHSNGDVRRLQDHLEVTDGSQWWDGETKSALPAGCGPLSHYQAQRSI